MLLWTDNNQLFFIMQSAVQFLASLNLENWRYILFLSGLEPDKMTDSQRKHKNFWDAIMKEAEEEKSALTNQF